MFRRSLQSTVQCSWTIRAYAIRSASSWTERQQIRAIRDGALRFNSAVRYLESRRAACLICIVSEDGDVTLLPRLRPRVSRVAVENAVVALVNYVNGPKIKPREFAALRSVVDRHRFYLDEDQCRRVNEAIAAVDSLEAAEPSSVRIVQVPFASDPTMNDSYWVPE